MANILEVEEVQIFIQDIAEKNHLLDTTEFPEVMIELAIDLALSEFNILPPISSYDLTNFPSKALLMSGVLYKLFAGQTALMYRNHMSYTDGGLVIPIEERGQFYQSLAGMYQADFMNGARALKIHLNIESGWGEIRSDYANFPAW
jgi:hypothetical protein